MSDDKQLNVGKQPKQRRDNYALKVEQIRLRAMEKGLDPPSQKDIGGMSLELGVTVLDIWTRTVLSWKESVRAAKAEIIEKTFYEQCIHEFVKEIGVDQKFREIAHEYAEKLRYGR
jgi:hypothetical protein